MTDRTKSPAFEIKPLELPDRAWVAEFIRNRWGSDRQVSRGRIYIPAELPGFAAWQNARPVGLVTYQIEGDQCELCTLDSSIERQGVGAALLKRVKAAAILAGCRRLWLITTNDNLNALRFYQKRGMTIAAIHVNALEQSRRLKPEIPLIGSNGIPLRDEIELELLL